MQIRPGFPSTLVPKGGHAIPGAPPADQEIHGEKRPDTVMIFLGGSREKERFICIIQKKVVPLQAKLT